MSQFNIGDIITIQRGQDAGRIATIKTVEIDKITGEDVYTADLETPVGAQGRKRLTSNSLYNDDLKK